ncbi:HAD family hydrolase [Acuticoccus sediminis]|uniref:HAD family hydrolase n=1 Tax=Acuticoccus sediminis TaxID=2184697 RepID=UPI001CFF315B|nr:HAD-IA family hydrolase [Acuticoccus sediminis]
MARWLMLDVDGVVVNGRPGDGGSWATDIERDLGISPDALQSVFFAPHWDAIVTGRADLGDVLEACLPALSRSVTAADVIDYWFARDSAVDEAVLGDCDALRAGGTRIALATNQDHRRAAYLMDRLGLGRHVDAMVHSAALGARKPDRAFFDAAAVSVGADPGDLVLVDDTARNVDAAREAGWRAIHWTKGVRLARLVAG